MASYAERAGRHLGSADLLQLETDELRVDGLIRAAQAVGEAAWLVSPPTRTLLPEIAWEHAAKMRHILVHHYREVSLEIVVGTIRLDFPPPISTIRAFLAENPE